MVLFTKQIILGSAIQLANNFFWKLDICKHWKIKLTDYLYSSGGLDYNARHFEEGFKTKYFWGRGGGPVGWNLCLPLGS